MGRSKWKGLFLDINIFKNLNEKLNKNNINVWTRRSVISSDFVSRKIFVYTGNKFKSVFITRGKVGFKFGEFCSTRNIRLKKKKLNKKKLKNKK